MSQFWKRVVATLLMLVVVFGFISINKNYGSEYGAYYMLVLLLIPGINSFIRLYAWSKPFVSSRFNIYTAKYKRNLIVNLPLEIAYEKFIEVIENSNLVLEKADDEKLEIFVYKKSSWSSSGENMYISFEETDDSTRMVVLLVSYKLFDEDTSHQALTDLIDQFENSLII
jgi:hypothetical protein